MTVIRRGLIVAALLVLAGCGSSKARTALESDGYTDIKLGDKAGGAYAFTATNRVGLKCGGTVKVTGGGGREINANCSGSLRVGGPKRM